MAEGANASVVMCQIGAREHYGVARALHKLGALDQLVTDYWCPPGQMSRVLPLRAEATLKLHTISDAACVAVAPVAPASRAAAMIALVLLSSTSVIKSLKCMTGHSLFTKQ